MQVSGPPATANPQAQPDDSRTYLSKTARATKDLPRLSLCFKASASTFKAAAARLGCGNAGMATDTWKHAHVKNTVSVAKPTAQPRSSPSARTHAPL